MKRLSGICSFTVAVFALLSLLTILSYSVSAETTKQKRERLKAQTSEQDKVHESGKSCVGFKYGRISSTHVTVRNVNWNSATSEGTWSGSFFFESRVAPTWYVGGALDVISGKVFSQYSNALYDLSANLKFNPLRQSNVSILPSIALGYAILPKKQGVPRTNFISKKLYLEFRLRLTPRLGIVADLGKWWVNGSNDFADVTGNCTYVRMGLIFL